MATRRFSGTVEEFCQVDASAMTDWIGAIPFEEWPQQDRLSDGLIRPAMVNDPSWHGFGDYAAPLMRRLQTRIEMALSGSEEVATLVHTHNPMLSVVMPGASIEPHVDMQPSDWLFRVHIPIQSDHRSLFIVGGRAHKLRPGYAYFVNTELTHSVENRGDVPRVHFMFDVRETS